MSKQFIVQETDYLKRRQFYEYITKKYNLKVRMEKEEMIDNKFPFIVDFDDNTFWVCQSITCCAMAAQNKKIITIEEFKKKEGKI